MRFLRLAGLLGLLGSALAQDVPDETIDRAVGALDTVAGIERLQAIAHGNWSRVLWHYKRANGAKRSRILSAVHYGGAPLWSPLLPLACEDPGWPNRQTAALLLERTAQDPKQRPLIVELQRKLARDSAWQVRMTVAAGLQWQSAPDVKPMLLKLAGDSHRFVRVQAAMSLGRMEDTRAIPLLIQALEEEEGFDKVQVLAYDGWGPGMFLATFGTKALPAILPLLKSGSPKKRAHGLGMLIELESEQLLKGMKPTLFERAVLFLHDPDPEVRLTALRALILNRDPNCLPYLVEALDDRGALSAENTVASTVEGWMKWGMPGEMHPWPAALEALKNARPTPEVTDAQIDIAIASLKTNADPNHYERLEFLCRGNWPRVVWNYKRADGSLRARILAATHYSGIWPTPLDELASEDPGWPIRQMVAIYAERSISNGKLPPSAEMLQEKLTWDRAWQVRIVVAKGLQWQYLPSVESTLVKYTRDPSVYVRIQAGMSLARRKDERAIPVLAELLDKQDGFPIVMDAGGEWRPENFLATFGDKMLWAVVPKLKSKSWKMRAAAIQVLICADSPKLLEYGKTLVNDPVPWVRYDGLRAVAWHRQPEAIPILVKALKDKTELAPRSTIADNVRILLQSPPEMGSEPWPEGIAALKAAEGKD